MWKRKLKESEIEVRNSDAQLERQKNSKLPYNNLLKKKEKNVSKEQNRGKKKKEKRDRAR